MITRKDLDACASLAREAQHLQESLMRLESLAATGRIPGGMIGGDGAPLNDSTGEGAAALADLKTKMRYRITAYIEHASLVADAIEAIRDERVRSVMRLYYMDGMIWEDVARRMHYDTRQCQRYRNRGLQLLGIGGAQATCR